MIAEKIRAAACIQKITLNAIFVMANQAGGDALRASADAGIRMN